ncbi:response regulator transcription factor [Nonomuraea sp. K274]|uniref:Response regulator transcription factor n=1 Tax=Nonomuraea cypriaca TaxID=1187855 RepID=A0A931A8V9_9ACTN|nr:response regulator transcription factor [Nonomuraea cypriaca]MBF8186168.1 response regulator transcription factor [Nonomuraea cypriaca]
MISVLVVDDQALSRAGMSALIRASPDLDVAEEAATGEEAAFLAAATGADVVLMNVRVPGIDGIATTERILALCERRPPRILILGGRDDLIGYAYPALRAGVAGLMLQDTPPARLLPAIRMMADGHILLTPYAVDALMDVWRPPDPLASTPDLASLTRREVEVLTLVGRALSNKDIARLLSVSEATVKTHLNRAMAKLRLSTRAHVVALAYDRGLVKPRHAGSQP